jgi:hypothetical protein
MAPVPVFQSPGSPPVHNINERVIFLEECKVIRHGLRHRHRRDRRVFETMEFPIRVYGIP